MLGEGAAMRVVGVDLSLRATGLAQLALSRAGEPQWSFETARSEKSTGSVAARAARLVQMRASCARLFFGSPLVVIEAPAFSRQAGARHERSGLWWMVSVAALEQGCRVVEVSPTARARYATGRGNATKAEVVLSVVERYGLWPANDNEADAIALAALGMRLAGLPIEARSEPWMEDVAATVLGEM